MDSSGAAFLRHSVHNEVIRNPGLSMSRLRSSYPALRLSELKDLLQLLVIDGKIKQRRLELSTPSLFSDPLHLGPSELGWGQQETFLYPTSLGV